MAKYWLNQFVEDVFSVPYRTMQDIIVDIEVSIIGEELEAPFDSEVLQKYVHTLDNYQQLEVERNAAAFDNNADSSVAHLIAEELRIGAIKME